MGGLFLCGPVIWGQSYVGAIKAPPLLLLDHQLWQA